MPASSLVSSSGVSARLKSTFRSLHTYNYRVWAAGTIVSNVGTWMQRIAQDWLVLTQLTHQSGTAVGIVMSLQFGPPIVLMPLTGMVADRVNRRKLLLATQSAMAATAFGLGALVMTGLVTLWHVYLFAGLMGCISSFDSPVRQIFIAELVGDEDLANAVALNSSLFNSAQLIGPAVAGVLIAAIGTGWLFIINGLSFIAVLASLVKMKIGELHHLPQASVSGAGGGGFAEGLLYVRDKPDLVMALTMLFLVGTYGLNFPIFISTMSVTVFHGGPHLYGALSSTMAVGSVIGALLAAGRERPRLAILAASALAFGAVCVLAAVMPNAWAFGAALVALGVVAQTFTTSTNSLVQLRTEPSMRGRVMAIYMAILMGCTPLGAPLVGWVADVYGPRWALGVGAASGFVATIFAFAYRRLRAVKARAQS
ncbi:enterobactin exporter EntS [mine drainage metagenome]|uniref:Enterobactin exporter EntS n=1 Tax=mine drainage metagenome TaxID=410659 RepID=A0A1J5QTB8_9ZZZZ